MPIAAAALLVAAAASCSDDDEPAPPSTTGVGGGAGSGGGVQGGGGATGQSCTTASECTLESPCQVAACIDGGCIVTRKVCPPAPIEDSWQTACASGAASFTTTAIGGECNSTCNEATGECEYTEVTVRCPPVAALSETGWLSQTEPWKVVLRNYLATLGGADFDVELTQLTWEPAALETADDLMPLFVLTRNENRTAPPAYSLRTPSDAFVLTRIEDHDGSGTDGLLFTVGRGRFIEPIDTTFWFGWDYAGNPFYGQPGLARRALLASMIDMIEQDTIYDDETEPGVDSGHSQLQSGLFSRWAFTYHETKAFLRSEPDGACVAAAYEAGLREMFQRNVDWDWNPGNTDMDQPSHVALLLTAEAIGDAELIQAADDESKELLSAELGYWDPAGYNYHDNGGRGPDIGYNGISLHFLTWAAAATRRGHLVQAVEDAARVRAHLTLPEGDGSSFTSPNHMNSASAFGVTPDQWGGVSRNYAVAMLSDHGKYWPFPTGHSEPAYVLSYLPDDLAELQAQTQTDVERGVKETFESSYESIDVPIHDLPMDYWSPQHWSHGFSSAVYYPVDGFFDDMQARIAAGAPELLPAVASQTSFVTVLGDDFVIAGTTSYAGILYAGEVADEWANGFPAGFGGGALSAFWTTATGPVLMGSTPGTQHAEPDTWSNWPDWATHATSGATPTGPFSTARVLEPTRTIDPATGNTRVDGVLSSTAGGGYSAPDANLADVDYTRTFTLDADRLTVETELRPSTSVSLAELVEALPLDQGRSDSGFAVQFETTTGTVAATTSYTADVQAIRVARYAGSVRIELDRARPVRLRPERTVPGTGRSVQVAQVDLLEGATSISSDRTITYTFLPN
jgi:hypothetical protein